MPSVNTNTVLQYKDTSRGVGISKDLDLNFSIHPIKKDINKLVGERAIINSIKNLILTNHYEKPFHPEIGSNVRKLLFENMDTITSTALEREITQTLQNFEPRITIKEVHVNTNFDNNAFDVSMQFYIVNRPELVTITFNLERLR